MIVSIRVKKEHIDSGEMMSCNTCPVALAITSVLGSHCTCAVNAIDVYIVDGKSWDSVFVKLPKSACNFIDKFDDFGKTSVKPFSFKLDIPEQYLAKQ